MAAFESDTCALRTKSMDLVKTPVEFTWCLFAGRLWRFVCGSIQYANELIGTGKGLGDAGEYMNMVFKALQSSALNVSSFRSSFARLSSIMSLLTNTRVGTYWAFNLVFVQRSLLKSPLRKTLSLVKVRILFLIEFELDSTSIKQSKIIAVEILIIYAVMITFQVHVGKLRSF